MKGLISYRPVSDLRSQVALFIIDEDDESGVQKPLQISHSQGCVLKFLCRMRYVIYFSNELKNHTSVHRFDFYPMDSHNCKLRMTTMFDTTQMVLGYVSFTFSSQDSFHGLQTLFAWHNIYKYTRQQSN